MKLFTITFFLFSTLLSAQDQYIDFLVPVKTYHFGEKEKYRYAYGEGGNMGLVISFTKNKHKINSVYTAGYIKNSYGKWSLIATYGKSYNATKWLRLEVNIGVATNYSDAYYSTGWVDPETGYGQSGVYKEGYQKTIGLKYKMADNLGFFYKNELLPIGALTSKVKIKKWAGIAISVNPYYVNAALMITLN